MIQKYLINDFSVRVFENYEKLYSKTGFQFPWIGYFVLFDDKMVGAGGFKSPPIGNTVEITYELRPGVEGAGYAARIFKLLTVIALKENPGIRITAKTIIKKNESSVALKKNGFKLSGTIHDPRHGLVWEWELDKKEIKDIVQRRSNFNKPKL